MTDSEKLQLLIDRAHIGELIHRYPVSIDARDWKLFRSIFTDEIQVYLGPPIDQPKLRTVSADKFTEQVAHASAVSTLHSTSSLTITLR